MLRSTLSPDRSEFYARSAGGRHRGACGGGVTVRQGDKVLAVVRAPKATDASGAVVPASWDTLAGSAATVTVVPSAQAVYPDRR